jgi:radial spoke head protein 9
MELYDLEGGLKSISSAGAVLNCQEITGITTGLTALKSTEKFQDMYFWGKVFGQSVDYYVAYGLKAGEFEFPSKAFYFAGEDFVFQPLPRPTPEAEAKVIELGGGKPFTGKADTPLEAPKEGEGEGEPVEGEEVNADKPKPLMEVDRLAQTVQEIDFDTAAVPTGAYGMNDNHAIVPTKDFKGLGITEATSLDRYVHFRPPASVASLRALARTDAQFYKSFLDQLTSDLPKGCWAVRQDPCATLVTLRSLSWPGYVAFHVPDTTKFGGCYFGYAQKNLDLPFLL